jgi:hypothetical protein
MNERDEIDDLFARLPPAPPPPDLARRARSRLAAIRGARRLTALALLDLLAIAGLGVLAFVLARQVQTGDLPALLALLVEDRELALAAWPEWSSAAARATPWPVVLLLALDALLVTTLTSYLLRATESVRAADRAGRRR